MTCTFVSLSQMVKPLICLRLNPQVSQLPFILRSNCPSFSYNYSFSTRPSYIRSPDSPVRPRSGVVMLPSYMHRRHVPTCTLVRSAFGPANHSIPRPPARSRSGIVTQIVQEALRFVARFALMFRPHLLQIVDERSI